MRNTNTNNPNTHTYTTKRPSDTRREAARNGCRPVRRPLPLATPFLAPRSRSAPPAAACPPRRAPHAFLTPTLTSLERYAKDDIPVYTSIFKLNLTTSNPIHDDTVHRATVAHSDDTGTRSIWRSDVHFSSFLPVFCASFADIRRQPPRRHSPGCWWL